LSHKKGAHTLTRRAFGKLALAQPGAAACQSANRRFDSLFAVAEGERVGHEVPFTGPLQLDLGRAAVAHGLTLPRW